MGWRPAFSAFGAGTPGPPGPQGNVGPAGPAGPPGSGGALRSFEYVADGTETNDFVLAIPAPALVDTNYTAIVVGAGLNFELTFDVIAADNTVNSIHVLASAVLTAGDVLGVVLQENT